MSGNGGRRAAGRTATEFSGANGSSYEKLTRDRNIFFPPAPQATLALHVTDRRWRRGTRSQA
jgi:hypothetical protein